MRFSWVVSLLVIAVAGPLASAAITNATAYVLPSEPMTLTGSQWDAAAYSLNVSESVRGGPAALLGGFETDVPGDPKAWIRKSVENSTSFDWSAYQIDIKMSEPFSILQTTGPAGWLNSATPSLQLPDGQWQAQVDFMMGSGAAVRVGDFGDFNILLEFLGPVNFSVTQTPIAPEPVSLALLALGGLFVRRVRR